VRKVLLADFLSVYRIEHIVEDNKTYRQVTISKHDGVSCRGEKLGRNIGRKRQFIIDLDMHPHTVLFTRQGVIDGSIGLATANVNKCIVTENMPMMSVNTDVIEIGYLNKLLISDYLLEKIRKLTIVGSAQKSIHERDFLNIEIELPNKDVQTLLCSKFSVLDEEHESLNLELTNQQSVLKMLRQRIMQEAIKGQLTASWRRQNPSIENADNLLERIAAEQSIKDKKVKHQKSLSPIIDSEKPFDLPEGWAWCRIGDISDVKVGATPARDNPDYWGLGVNWVSSGEVANNYIDYTKETITNKGMNESSAKINPAGSVLVAMIGQGKTRGQTAILNIDAATNQNVAAIRLSSYIKPEIIWYFFLSRYEATRSGASGGNQPALNGLKISDTVFGLPPQKEIDEIISRLKSIEIMLSQLGEQITSNQVYTNQLMQSVLKEAFSQNGKVFSESKSETTYA